VSRGQRAEGRGGARVCVAYRVVWQDVCCAIVCQRGRATEGEGEPTACREGMVSAAILLDELEHAVPDGHGAAAAVAVGPIVATELAAGHKRVVVGVRLQLHAGQLVGWHDGRARTHVRLERRARVVVWSVAQIGHWR